MMNNIKKYIDLLKSEKERAKKEYEGLSHANQMVKWREYTGCFRALSFCIDKAELLLKTENEKQQ